MEEMMILLLLPALFVGAAVMLPLIFGMFLIGRWNLLMRKK